MSTRNELDAAHQLLTQLVARYGPPKVHELYFKGRDGGEDLLALNTLKNVLRDNLHGKSSETKAAVLRVYHAILAERDREAEARIYHILKNMFELDDQSSAHSYVGRYVCYRIQTGTVPPNLLDGIIEIEHVAADNSYQFTHISDHSGLETDNPRLIHTGAFFVLVNRVYLVGLSSNDYGANLRPIILRAHANPKRVPMRGVLLTEAATGNVPVAARTVLYHEDLHAAMKAEHPGDEMNRAVLAELRADAWNPTLENGEPVNATNLLGW